jgi:hypothetical protein
VKKIILSFLILAAVGLFYLTFNHAMYVKQKMEQYQKAEPYVEIVWPLSSEMKEFEKKNGRRPDSLAELRDVSDQDLSKIEEFEHRFYGSGPVVFEIEINETHGFQIDGQYSPSWKTTK